MKSIHSTTSFIKPFLLFCLAVSLTIIQSPTATSQIDPELHSSQKTCHGASHLHGLSWIDPKVPVKADLLCIHGMGLCAKAYDEFGKRMSQLGIATYAVDVTGLPNGTCC